MTLAPFASLHIVVPALPPILPPSRICMQTHPISLRRRGRKTVVTFSYDDESHGISPIRRAELLHFPLLSETKAEILHNSHRRVRSGGTLRLTCRVYLGRNGPDEEYKRSAVVHWFHGQRLLDAALEQGSR